MSGTQDLANLVYLHSDVFVFLSKKLVFTIPWNGFNHDNAQMCNKFMSKCVSCGGCPTRCHRAGASTPCNSCPGASMIHKPTPELTFLTGSSSTYFLPRVLPFCWPFPDVHLMDVN